MRANLRARLARLRDSGEIQSSSASTAKRLQESRKEFLFPQEEVFAETKEGLCYYREHTYPLTQYHGSGPLSDLLACNGKDLILTTRDKTHTNIRPEESLFLDIETTGLSGGTGTWVVLIGLGWKQANRFHLRQYFLTNPAHEKAMLFHVAETMRQFPGVVTFNGRTFDLPMIKTRHILAGLTGSLEPSYHIDLLPCARRLWKARLISCSLKSLESGLLGLRRFGDVPGGDIPLIYFDYLRSGKTSGLRDIFEHNVLDVLSMVRLLVLVAHAGKGKEPVHPADYFSLGKLYAENGRMEEAIQCCRQAFDCGDERLEMNALLYLSFIYKKQGMWHEAKALWDELVRRHCQDLTPYLELAKYYEHRAKNYHAALAMTEYALKRVKPHLAIAAFGQKKQSALLYRKARLIRKSQSC